MSGCYPTAPLDPESRSWRALSGRRIPRLGRLLEWITLTGRSDSAPRQTKGRPFETPACPSTGPACTHVIGRTSECAWRNALRASRGNK